MFTNSSGTKLSAWESIGYDENNNRKTETVTQAQPAGATPAVQSGTGTFDYNPLDRLNSFKHPFETTAPVTYGLDDAGNVISESAPAVTFTFANNRLTGRTPALPALPSSYGYDHFGNQTTDTEIPLLPTTTSYNAASQTKRVTAFDGTWVEYGYDGLERMVSRTDNTGEVVLFFHDGLSDQIALEHDMTEAMVTTRYLVDSFGVARGKQDIDNSTGASYYMTDPRANVTQMIGASDQAVKAVFAYDPYGKDKTALSKKLTADWDSRLKFQMAPKDPKTASYSIGSRLMNPAINRFVGSDNYVASGANLGLQADPLSGNRYLYAGANPAGLIDDGHTWRIPRGFGQASTNGLLGQGVKLTDRLYAEVPDCPMCNDAYKYLVEHELRDYEAAAVIGNFMWESSGYAGDLYPHAVQLNGGPGRGLAQWDEPVRWANLLAWSNKSEDEVMKDVMLQIAYVPVELAVSERNARRKLAQARNVGEATFAISEFYERAGDKEHGGERTVYASMVYAIETGRP